MYEPHVTPVGMTCVGGRSRLTPWLYVSYCIDKYGSGIAWCRSRKWRTSSSSTYHSNLPVMHTCVNACHSFSAAPTYICETVLKVFAVQCTSLRWQVQPAPLDHQASGRGVHSPATAPPPCECVRSMQRFIESDARLHEGGTAASWHQNACNVLQRSASSCSCMQVAARDKVTGAAEAALGHSFELCTEFTGLPIHPVCRHSGAGCIHIVLC